MNSSIKTGYYISTKNYDEIAQLLTGGNRDNACDILYIDWRQ